MKSNTAISNALKNSSDIRAIPELIIDWNMNRYIGGVADNTPSDATSGFDVEIFPVESIIAPNRPTKGINKARIGSGTVGNDYYGNGYGNGRFYVADVDDTYKYWTSPAPSNALGNISNVKPQVIYSASVAVNKIVITTENSWASAKTFSIQTTTSATPTDSSGWTEVANQTSVGNGWKNSGQITLYYNGSSWVVGARVDNADKTPKTTTIRGVRLVVTSLEGGYQRTADGSIITSTYLPTDTSSTPIKTTGYSSFFDLIEISARLEVDLSNYLISFSHNSDMADASGLYPIGTITTNQGEVSLSNIYTENGVTKLGFFSADNVNSPYNQYIEPNAELNLFLNYYDANNNFLGRVQEFKMYTETWAGQDTDTVSVDLSDYSKFFDNDDMKVPASLWEDLTVPQIICRILDSVGFVDYMIDTDPNLVTQHTIPVFYTDGQQTVWEVLGDLSKASQTAVYFDSYGKLRVKTREFAMGSAVSSSWDFVSDSSASKLSDIISASVTTSFEPNYYTVTYQKTDWAAVENSMPITQQVWTPEQDTVLLRGTPLVRSMGTSDNTFWIGSDDVKVWPYSSLVNIDGELIRYEGKEFIYYTGSSGQTLNRMYIKSNDQYLDRNNSTPLAYQHLNHFTGQLKITERGVWNSENKSHSVDINGYSVHQYVGGSYLANVSGLRQLKQDSRAELSASPPTTADMKLATRGASTDSPLYNYGTKLRFVKEASRVNQRAGIVIHNSGTKEDGYYVEIMPLLKEVDGTERKALAVYSRINGSQTLLKSVSVEVTEGLFNEIDVEWRQNPNGDHVLNVYFDGRIVSSSVITGSNRVTPGGKFGMFIRGKTKAEFEYLYGIARQNEPYMQSDFSFLNRVDSAYRGEQWEREFVYKTKTARRRVKKKWVKEQVKYNQMFFDDFGPTVHEIREFDAIFDPAPVDTSRLFMSNDWDALCIEYRSTPFGAHFYIANTSRGNAVIKGDDSITNPLADSPLSQQLSVIGRVLVTDQEASTQIASNPDQIRKRGKVVSDLTSQWIQTDTMAQDIADWMNSHFSYGNDTVEVDVFGNPLIEIGDVVTMNYPEAYIQGTFFVYGIDNSFDNGLTTSLTLRRKVA